MERSLNAPHLPKHWLVVMQGGYLLLDVPAVMERSTYAQRLPEH